jgi:5-methylcytosine-specific restriction endonuclease McrA
MATSRKNRTPDDLPEMQKPILGQAAAEEMKTREVAPYREGRYTHGLNSTRTIRQARQNRNRARRAGLQDDRIDIGRFYHERHGVCGICGQVVPFDVFTVDHIIPLSKGGAHAVANLQRAHLACNIRKGNRISLQE